MGIEISKRAVGLVIGILLMAAVSSPFLFFLHVPDQDEVIELSLEYTHHVATYTSQDGWDVEEDEIIRFSFYVSLNNLSDTLRSETIANYPLWVDVGSWDVGSSVSLRDHSGTVDDDMQYYGHECWVVAIDDHNSVYYAKNWGLLIEKRYSRMDITGFMEYSQSINECTLTESNLEDFGSTYVKPEGLFFSGILVQLAIVIGYIYDRRSSET